MIAYFDDGTYNMNIAPFISIHEMFPGHHLKIKAPLKISFALEAIQTHPIGLKRDGQLMLSS